MNFRKIKTLQTRLKECKLDKKTINRKFFRNYENNEIECFDINNGKLLLHKSKIKCALNKLILTYNSIYITIT